MTRNTWIRIFVASLIVLGDWAFAAENRLRADAEAADSEFASQISKQTILDDSESSLEPVITVVGTAPPKIFTFNHKLASVTCTVPIKLKYLPLHPRAPPIITAS